MEKNKQLVILIIIGVFLFLLGGVIGIAYDSQTGPQQVKVKTVNSLTSKVVSSITAYGKITNINGKNLTLNNLGDNLVFLIADNAQIYSFTIPAVANKNNTIVPVQKLVQ